MWARPAPPRAAPRGTGCWRAAPRRHARRRPNGSSSNACRAAAAAPLPDDAFAALGDRVDAPPLPLPALPPGSRRRAVLVRHGQSTWNAGGRIQGSSDASELTAKGAAQAAAAAAALAAWRLDACFASPLRRAAATADAVWAGRPGPRATLPALREIDLYSFQGLLKSEGRARRGAAYAAWQARPAEFVVDGRAPVRELWHRASLAWRALLPAAELAEAAAAGGGAATALVVAHNAVNQALVCAALGLPPAHFRRLAQSNGAFTVVDFEWGGGGGGGGDGGGAPAVTLERLNQAPGSPVAPLLKAPSGGGARPGGALVLVAGAPGSPPVAAALARLAGAGLAAAAGAPRAVGRADEVAAAAAPVAAAGGGRTALVVAPPAAVRAAVARCLGGGADLAARLGAAPGGVSVVEWGGPGADLGAGALTCLNHQFEGE